MQIVDTCPDCGAEQPSWLGSSHYRRCYAHGSDGPLHPLCCDGKSPEEYWINWTPAYSNRLLWQIHPTAQPAA